GTGSFGVRCLPWRDPSACPATSTRARPASTTPPSATKPSTSGTTATFATTAPRISLADLVSSSATATQSSGRRAGCPVALPHIAGHIVAFNDDRPGRHLRDRTHGPYRGRRRPRLHVARVLALRGLQCRRPRSAWCSRMKNGKGGKREFV